MKLTDKLDLLMEEKKINKAVLSKNAGIPYSTIANFYEKGTENVKLSTLKKLAKYFDVSLDYIADDDVEERNIKPKAQEHNPSSILMSFELNKKIPVVGVIRAGEPILAEQNIIGFVELPSEFVNNGDEYFGLKIVGNSMNLSRIFEGDIVIVRKQNYVENGEIAIVLVNGEDATIKKFYQEDTIVTLVPNSSDSSYSPKTYDLRNVPIAVLGKVVKAIIDF